MSHHPDVAVLGSGFAGSLLATCLTRRGLSVVLVERDAHPRFAVGESSTPAADATLRTLAEEFDLPWLVPLSRYGSWKDTHPELGVGCKRGFSYFAHRPGEPFSPGVDHADELLVAATGSDANADTHWLRADVDAHLARRAVDHGVTLLERTTVVGVERSRDARGGWRVTCRGDDGEMVLRPRFLVDSTGAAGVLARHLGLPRHAAESFTDTTAAFVHLAGVEPWGRTLDRLGVDRTAHPFPCDRAAVHHVLPDGWLWELPFDHGVSSFGRVWRGSGKERESGRAVGRASCSTPSTLNPQPRRPPPELLDVARFPTLADRLATARVIAGPVRTGRLQRLAAVAAGGGFALLPTTAGFVDPLHGTGIAHALSGMLRLARVLPGHLGRASPAGELAGYSAAVVGEVRHLDSLISCCYAGLPDFDRFALGVPPYAAAATCGERGRGRGFLLSDDPAFRGLLADLRERIRRDPISGVRRWLRAALAPWDSCGLFDPAVPNLHARTAVPGT